MLSRYTYRLLRTTPRNSSEDSARYKYDRTKLGRYKFKVIYDLALLAGSQRNDYQSRKQRRTKVQTRLTFITKIGIQKPKGKFKTEYHRVSDHMLVTSHGTCFPTQHLGATIFEDIHKIIMKVGFPKHPDFIEGARQ